MWIVDVAATYGAQRSRDCHVDVDLRVATFRTFLASMSDYCTVMLGHVTRVTVALYDPDD